MIRIFLIGYMGAGKTTLGKALSKDMNLPFIDLDWYIEERFHKTIKELFEERGEKGFRQLESQLLREVGEFENVIISCGGGTPCFFHNMEYMNSKGDTVYLNVKAETLFRRLKISRFQRPLLQGKSENDLIGFIIDTLDKRQYYYRQANYIFNVEELENRNQIYAAVKQLKELIGMK